MARRTRKGSKMKRTRVGASAAILVAAMAAGCATQRGDDGFGWTALIDGEKGLEHWDRVGLANWRGIAGVVRADQRKGDDGGYLVSKQTYKDFELHAEFWVDETANSGIFIRCTDAKKIAPDTCYEVNIFDKRPDPAYGTGAIVDFARIHRMPKAAGRWNTFDITASGDRLIVKMNGETTVDIHNDRFASGAVALQYASGVVKFRKVSIKPI